jgi:hypothetical protein
LPSTIRVDAVLECGEADLGRLALLDRLTSSVRMCASMTSRGLAGTMSAMVSRGGTTAPGVANRRFSTSPAPARRSPGATPHRLPCAATCWISETRAAAIFQLVAGLLPVFALQALDAQVGVDHPLSARAASSASRPASHRSPRRRLRAAKCALPR